MTLEIATRPFVRKTDENFVIGCWSAHIRPLPPFTKFSDHEFLSHMHLISRSLDVEDGFTIIACAPDNSDQLFGFISVGPGRALNMIYVRNTWRQMGIANRLMEEAFSDVGKVPIYVTHPSQRFNDHKKRWALKFNPYLFQVTQ